MHKRNTSNKGFTIVELLIVVVVIAILAAISVVAYTGIQNRAYDSAIQNDLSNMAKKIQLEAAESGVFPSGGAHIQTASSSESGDSTVFPGFVFRPSKNSYATDTINLFYCTGRSADNDGGVFRIRARSRSGNTFQYGSDGGISNLGNVSIGYYTSLCQGLDYPRSGAYGHHPTYGWYSWTN